MKLKRFALLAIAIFCISAHTHICADDQINPDDILDAKTYVQWKKNEPEKIAQLKAYIISCVQVNIDDSTLEREIKRAIGVYKSRTKLTIDALIKKIAAKYMKKKSKSILRAKQETKQKTAKPAVDISTEDMSINTLKEKLYHIQNQIKQAIKTKYVALSLIKLECNNQELEKHLQEICEKLEQLYFERDTILEFAKRNGQKSVGEITKLTQVFDNTITKIEKYYQDDLKELI